jgi:hypothetical protein
MVFLKPESEHSSTGHSNLRNLRPGLGIVDFVSSFLDPPWRPRDIGFRVRQFSGT